MKLYRYEFQKDNKKIGILTGLDDYFTDDEIFSVCGIFEMRLDEPSISMQDTKSYFTEKGNRKFRKAIRKIQKIAESKNIEVICEQIDKENLEDILYEDIYQVIILQQEVLL